MGYSHCGKLNLRQGSVSITDNYYFHKEDIDEILKQAGAEKCLCIQVKGKVPDSQGKFKEGMGIIGAAVDVNGNVTNELNGPAHLIALSCRPFNNKALEYIDNP